MRPLGWVAVIFVASVGANAQAPLDPKTMQSAEIESLQRRLTDARCYAGAIDGKSTDALTKAIGACPDQRPILRIETGTHEAPINRIAADPQCRLIASVSEDKTVRLWSVPQQRLLRTVRMPIGAGNNGKLYGVAVSPDARWIAAGGWDAGFKAKGGVALYLFDAETGGTMRRLGAYADVINSLAFSPDGRRLAVGLSGGKGLRMLEVATGRELFADREFGDRNVVGLAFLRDDGLLAVALDGSLRRYGADGRLVARLKTRGKLPTSVAVDNGDRIAVGFQDTQAAELYDLPDLRFVRTVDPPRRDSPVNRMPEANLSRVAWSSDGHLFAGGLYGIPDPAEIMIRSFDRDGRQSMPDVRVGASTVQSLVPCGDRIALSAEHLGLISTSGAVTIFGASVSVDMRGKKRNAFTVSRDGRRVRFTTENSGDGRGGGSAPAFLFDLGAGTLTDVRANPPDLEPSLLTGLPVSGWENENDPRLGTMRIPLTPFEQVTSLAIRPDRTGFVLGSSKALRGLGTTRAFWALNTPGTAWGLNLGKGGDLVLAAYNDGTIRWYRWKDGQELLALFVDRKMRAWVAWTPTGYYAASPGAEGMIGWHINRGWEQPADFFPASKFRDTYARPDIVERVLDTMDEAEAVRQANAARPDRSEAKAITDILPPVVTIVSPTDGVSVSGNEITVDYSVRSPSGLPVDAVEALVDGRPASRERGLGRADDAVRNLRDCLQGARGLGRTSEGPGACRGSITVQVPPGTQEIGLFARTGERVGDVARLRVIHAAAVAGPTPQKPRLFSLVVGISTYANPDYTLQYAAKDAQDFSAVLANQKGGLYEDVSVRVLTDVSASRVAVLDGLDWLTKQVTNHDVGVVYLAGHGVLDTYDRFYFVAADTNVDQLRATGLAREDIQVALDALPGKALLFLDACHAGAVSESKVRRGGQLDINGVANEFTRTERGVVMFAASTGKQVSQENAVWGNGAFTEALIEALGAPGQKGKADLLGKGAISASALDAYVSARVRELTDGRQSPVMIRPSTVPDFTLAVVR